MSNCWKKVSNKVIPVFASTGNKIKSGFGDGGFWDRTPQVFDNGVLTKEYTKVEISTNAAVFNKAGIAAGTVMPGA